MEDTGEQRTFLRFGDTVTLFDVSLGGFCSGEGLLDDRLFVDVLRKSVTVPPNLKECCFVIYNKFEYTAKKTFEKELSNQRVKRSAITDAEDDRGRRQSSMMTNLRIKAQREEEERYNNELQFKRMQTESLHYGATVQLRHAASGRFVTILKERAPMDGRFLKTVLIEDGNEASWFVVQPGYKAYKYGDRVSFGDSAVFSSAKFANASLHVSANSTVPNVKRHPYVQRALEVNAAPEPSLMKLVPHSLGGAKSKSLVGGSYVTLYHREAESYLVAENGNVDFKKLPMNQASGHIDSNSVWKIEANEAEWAGGNVEMVKQTYRIKHAATNLYINLQKVIKGGKTEEPLGLTEMYLQESTLWSFHYMSDAREDTDTSVPYGSLVLMKNKANGQWLVADMEDGDSSDSDGEETHNLNAARLYTGAETRHTDVLHRDALEVSAVKEDDLHDIVEVRNATRQFERFSKALLATPRQRFPDKPDPNFASQLKSTQLYQLFAQEAEFMGHVLTQLILRCTEGKEDDPFTRNGPPDQKWQQTIAEQDTCNVIVGLTKIVFEELKIPVLVLQPSHGLFPPAVHKMMQLCFRFVTMAMKENRFNQHEMGAHLDYFQTKLGGDLRVADTLSELFRDNLSLLQKVSEVQVQRMVDVLKKRKRGRFLQFLGTLAVCSGTPLPRNQNMVTELLLQKSPATLLDVSYQKDGIFLRENGVRAPPAVNLAESLAKVDSFYIVGGGADAADDYGAWAIGYWFRTLELFSDLCAGRNRFAIDTILKDSNRFGVRYERLMELLKSNFTPYLVKGKVLKLLVVLYIDREPLEPVYPLSSIKVWSKAVPEGVGMDHTSVDPFENFEDLRPPEGLEDVKRFCTDVFKDHSKEEYSSDIGRCVFLLETLHAMETMMKLGLYHKRKKGNLTVDMKSLSKVLVSIIPMLDDRGQDGPRRRKSSSNSRFHMNERTQYAMQIKLQLCEMLSWILDCSVASQVDYCFTYFDRLYTANLKELETPNTRRKSLASHIPHVRSKARLKKKGDRSNSIVSLTGGDDLPSAVEYMRDPGLWKDHPLWKEKDIEEIANHVFVEELMPNELLPPQSTKEPTKLFSILLELARYEYQPLVVKVFSVLTRIVKSRALLVSHLLSMQTIVFPEVATLYHQVQFFTSELRRQRKWLMATNDKVMQRKAFDGIVDITEQLTSICTEGAAVTVGGQKITVKPQDITKYQDLLRNVRAHRYCLDILKLNPERVKTEAGTPDQARNKDLVRVFSQIYRFFSVFAVGNRKNQEALWRHIELFQSHMGISGLNVADAIAATLRDNRSVCDRVSEEFIRAMFGLLVENGKMARWLRVLEAAVIVKQQPHIRNARNVVKVMSIFERDAMLLFKDKSGSARRFKLMQQREHKRGLGTGSELRYHTTCVMLLGKCCTGKNPSAEVKAQSLLSFQDTIHALLEVDKAPLISDRGWGRGGPAVDWDTVRYVKAPFVKFLHEVFVMTDNSEAFDLVSSNRNGIWEIGETTGGPGAPDTPVMGGIARDLKDYVVARHHYFGSSFKRAAQKLTNHAATIKAEAKKAMSRNDMNEFTSYVFDTVFLFLKDYFNKFGKPEVDGNDAESCIEDIVHVVEELVVDSQISQQHREAALDVVFAFQKAGLNVDSTVVEKASTVPDDVEERTPEDAAKLGFKVGFLHYSKSLGRQLGIEDFHRMLGVGVLVFSRMLTGEKIDPNRNFTYREVVWKMFHVLMDQPASLSDSLTTELLRISRALVYLDDPNSRTESEVQSDWHLFLDNEPPSKSEPSEKILEWVQNKYNSLGGGVMAIQLVSHQDSMVRLAATRLGIAMLEGGNKQVQDSILSMLIKTRSEVFWVASKGVLARAVQEVKELKKVKKRAALLTRVSGGSGTKGGAGTSNLSSAKSGRTLASHVSGGNDKEMIDSEDATGTFFTDSVALLRLLQLMCEGHHSGMQNMMREQPHNANSHDLITEAVSVLAACQGSLIMMLEEGDASMAKLSIQVCHFLTETMQGPCEANQYTLSRSDFVAIADRVLGSIKYEVMLDGQERRATVFHKRKKKEDESESETVNEVKLELSRSLLLVLVSMLEGVHSNQIPRRLLAHMEAKKLTANLVRLLHPKLGFIKQIPDLKEGLEEEAMLYWILMQTLSEFDSETGDFRAQHAVLEAQYPELLSFLQANTGSVEIHRDGKVERIYFRIPHDCLRLKAGKGFRNHCEEEIADIPRDNPEEKAQQLLSKLNALNVEIDIMSKLLRHPLWSLVIKARRFIDAAPFYLSLFLLLAATLTYGTDEDPYSEVDGAETTVFVLGIIHVVITVCFFISYWVVEGEILFQQLSESNKLISSRALLDSVAGDLQDLVHFNFDDKEKEEEGEQEEKSFLQLTSEEIDIDDEERMDYDRVLPPPPIIERDTSVFARVQLVAWSMWPMYYLIFMTISVIALVYSPFLYSIHLLDYFRRPGGRMVMQSIYVGGPKLWRTGFLGMLMLLMFGSISFLAFRDDSTRIDDTTVAIDSAMCRTAYSCMSNHFVSGLQGSLNDIFVEDGITGHLWDDSDQQLRMFYIMVFFVVWEFLLQGIITGQIIDAFSEIRNARDEQDRDSQENCLVCSVARFTFEQYGAGFQQHITEDHNPWDYLFFMQHLKIKDKDEFTGLESYVYNHVTTEDHSFIPIQNAIVLQRRPPDPEVVRQQEMDTRLSGIEKTLENIQDVLQSLRAPVAAPADTGVKPTNTTSA